MKRVLCMFGIHGWQKPQLPPAAIPGKTTVGELRDSLKVIIDVLDGKRACSHCGKVKR